MSAKGSMKTTVSFGQILLIGALCCLVRAEPPSRPIATSEGQSLASPAKLPSFSWDTVPVWLRVRKSTAYTPEEIARIARYPLVVFEKANGYGTYGNVESGTVAAAKAVKQVNPNTKIIFYFNAVIEYGNYRANEEFDKHADTWAVRKNGRIFQFKDTYRLFDLSQPAVQQWWAKTAESMAGHPEIDGVFIDAICKALTHGDAYMAGYWQMAERLRSGLGENKLLLANAVRAAYPNCNLDHLKYLDGSYVERWSIPVGSETYEDYVARSIEAMMKVVEQKKVLLFSAGPDAFGREQEDKVAKMAAEQLRQWMRANISYPLGIFLIVAGEHSYFDGTCTPDALQGALTDHDYPEYHHSLGKPLGKAARDGYIYTRQYEHLDVRVDIKNKQSKLTWH
jgi:hypothetical protein